MVLITAKLRLLVSAALLWIGAASSAIADASDYKLKPIADLAKHNSNIQQWLTPLPNPKSQQQLYLPNKNGQIFILDYGHIEINPMLDLSEALFATENIMLTAFALHPNFSFRKLLGYNIFYTAHVESFNEDTDVDRMRDKHNTVLSHDAVLTEWSLNVGGDSKHADLSSKREILRIAINNPQENITQLGFDPNSKPWGADYGLLHIALSSSAELHQSPLYSGAILRLNPTTDGLKNYTIPSENPFIDDIRIQNEIIIFGAQHISHFIWSKEVRRKLLLNHQFDLQAMLSLARIGADLRQKNSNKLVWQTAVETQEVSGLFYRGTELPALWVKALVLSKNAQQWQLSSFALDNKPKRATETLAVEWLIDTDKIALDSNVSIHVTHNDEILLLDHTGNMLYQIVSDASASAAGYSKGIIGWIIGLVLLVIILFFMFRFRTHNLVMQSKILLGSQFTRFQVNPLEQSISLFRRHITWPHRTLELVDIISSEIFLNEKSISSINTGPKNGFNDAKEKIIIECFEQERREKMQNEKTRKVNLVLRDSDNNKYIIYVYHREGKQRLTKMDFSHILGQLIDWSWHIAKIINPDATSERTVKAPEISLSAGKKSAAQQNNKTPNKVEPEYIKSSHLNNNSMLTTSTASDAHNNPTIQSNDKHNNDIHLVTALEKLALLKEQGYLSEAEFSLSKANMLDKLP